MATANTITDGAYKKIGIETPTSPQDEDALFELNNMLSMWGTDFVVPYITRESDTLVVGTSEYTIGSGGDLNTVRPMSIASSYLVDSDNYSHVVKIRSASDYNRTPQKTYDGRPGKLYFIPEYPLAKIIFDREPEYAYTVNYEFWKQLTELALITTTFEFPNEYKRPMVYNLAIALAENNSITPSPTVIATAQETYSLIKRVTAINRPPPTAKFDFGSGLPSIITTGE